MERDWQQLTLLTPAPPPISPCQMKKKPATLARRRSDCFVQKDKQRFVVKRSFYNDLARNKDWPPLPTPSPISPARQGKNPAPLERRRRVNFRIEVKKFYFQEMKQRKRDESKKERKQVRKRKRKCNCKSRRTKERKQWREWNAKLEQHADKLDKFFQQIGQKSESEQLEEQIKKEVIEFEEQLEEHLEQELIEQVEQFEKERFENEEQFETELIEYAEQLENERIAQEEQHEKELTSGTLLYYAWNKKNRHKRWHNEDVSKMNYLSERCILTNRPTATSFQQYDPFLHDAWCKKKKHKTDEQNEIKRHSMWCHLQPAVSRQHTLAIGSCTTLGARKGGTKQHDEENQTGSITTSWICRRSVR